MNDEEKKQLKEMLSIAFGAVMHLDPKKVSKGLKTILSLIDRQPSEGHLKLINMVLSQINSREMWATRADYEMARMALDRIRKALGLEEG